MPIDLGLLEQALELMEKAYALMLDHEDLFTDEHMELTYKMEDCIDRLMYLQIPDNVRKW